MDDIEKQSKPGLEAEVQEMLVRLSGNALDLPRLSTDLATTTSFIRILSCLWDFPVGSIHPAPIFSPSWEGEQPDA